MSDMYIVMHPKLYRMLKVDMDKAMAKIQLDVAENKRFGDIRYFLPLSNNGKICMNYSSDILIGQIK